MDDVLVLMSTYNGEKYIKEQIDSLLNQKNVNVSILVRDDGSKDSTINILEEYKRAGQLDYYLGNNLRPARSFMHLINHAPRYEYYALSDQDDVWLPDKLYKAVCALRNVKVAGLYYHAMNLVDSELQKYGYYFRKEAYARSIEYSCLFGDEIAGCTMVFNEQLLNAIRFYNPEFITMHDGWVHRVCLCVGGTIIGDETAYINYRQHGNNTVGMRERTLGEKIKILLRKEKKLSSLANEMLKGYQPALAEKDINFLELFAHHNGFGKKKKIMSIASSVCNDSKKKINLAIKLLYKSF